MHPGTAEGIRYTVNTAKGKRRRQSVICRTPRLSRVTARLRPEMDALPAYTPGRTVPGAIKIASNETVDGPTAKRLGTDNRFTIHKVMPFGLQVIKFNQAQAPANDVNFRLAVQAALGRLKEDAAQADRNLMPAFLDCARVHASEGEMVEALQEVFGSYTETPVF